MKPSKATNRMTANFFKAAVIAAKAAAYAYKMAAESRSFENIVGMEDDLTGMPNRRAFNAYVEKQGRCAVALIDCDNFKRINDTEGHARGDETIREIGAALKEQPAFAARLGGDEFVMVFDPDSDIKGIIDCVRKRIRSWSGITISVGVCADVDVEVYERMKRADAALYMSKEKGRDSVSWWGAPHAAPMRSAGRSLALASM
jgi:diguanylate cyclase (GGDEF)-like protein